MEGHPTKTRPGKKPGTEKSTRLKRLARSLRHQASDAERRLWQHLRDRRLDGFKFRRQQVIEPYIVDFICPEARLIIEADGGQHIEQAVYDAQRTAYLEDRGYRIMRFWNHEIMGELDSVLEAIRNALIETAPHPGPLPKGERE